MDTTAGATSPSSGPAAPAAYNMLTGGLAAIAGAALFCLVFWATGERGPMPVQWPEWTSNPVHLTPLFALPLCLFLMNSGKMRPLGAVTLAVVMTAAHWVAMEEAIRIAIANDMTAGANAALMGGLAGGALGAFATFFLLRRFGPEFRTARASGLALIAIILLAAIGAYGLGIGSPANLLSFVTGKPFTPPELEPSGLILSLYLPWQILYGLVLVRLFKDHELQVVT